MTVEREEGIAHAKERRDGVTDELLSTELVASCSIDQACEYGNNFFGIENRSGRHLRCNYTTKNYTWNSLNFLRYRIIIIFVTNIFYFQ